MGQLIKQRRDIGAGSQFAGTEFSVASRAPGRKFLKLKQALLQMGVEPKTWRLVVVDADSTQIALLQQSVDGTGAPAATTDESVILKGEDIEVVLDQGQQVQIVTAGALSAMVGTLYFEEVDFT